MKTLKLKRVFEAWKGNDKYQGANPISETGTSDF
jgi:hypothetical protein